MIAYYLYQFGYFISTRLPLRAAYAIATFLSVFKFYISPRDRRAVIANLKRILPPERQADHQPGGKQKESRCLHAAFLHRCIMALRDCSGK